MRVTVRVAVCKLLAAHDGVRRSAVSIVAGESGRTKIVEIDVGARR